MSVPPRDHGTGRYDYVEISTAPGVEAPPVPPELVQDPCQDCRANVFLHWDGQRWLRTIAHDDGCPSLAQMQASTCAHCGRTSWNPNDVENRYCGSCHHFCEDG